MARAPVGLKALRARRWPNLSVNETLDRHAILFLKALDRSLELSGLENQVTVFEHGPTCHVFYLEHWQPKAAAKAPGLVTQTCPSSTHVLPAPFQAAKSSRNTYVPFRNTSVTNYFQIGGIFVSQSATKGSRQAVSNGKKGGKAASAQH
jgi:hypothetical protein